MARLHSDLGQRTVYLPNGLAKAQGLPVLIYKDAAGTQPANLATYQPQDADTPGAAIAGAVLVVDAYSNRPAFWDLDDLDVLYITANGGPLEPIYPDPVLLIAGVTAAAEAAQDAADAAQATANARETPSGAQAKADAAQAAAISAASADATSKASAAQAAAISAAATDATSKANAAQSAAISAAATDATTKADAAQSAAISAAATDATSKANAAQAAAIAASAQRASNLSDLASAATARTNLGLGSVDNTSDANKPISTATATALAGKRAVPANYIDPAVYGVIPSVSTDRTAAFQAMLDAIPAAGGSEIGGAYIELPKGVILLNTPTSGVLLKLTNKPNVTIRGAGSGTILRVSSAVATEILRLETCNNFKLENVLVQVIGTAQVGKAIHYTTETGVGSAHLGRFTNVVVSCNGAYRRAWDFMTASGSPTVYSAMAAFAAGDVGGNLMINLTGGAWQAGITAVSTLSATLAADITTTTATTVTLNAALPGAPASGFTIQVDTERMYVTAGGNTTTLTVTRGRGADGIRTTHTAGAAVVTYSATLDSNAPSSSSTASAPGRIQPAGAARLDVGLAIGTDHPGSPDLDVANTYLSGFSAARCHVAGIQVGNGTTGDILDHWMHGSSISECGYGVYLTAGSMTVNDCDFSTNVVDVRRFQPVSQECKIDGVRTEGPAIFYEMTGAGTSGPTVRIASVQIQTFNAEDGVPIRHLSSSNITLEEVDITSSRVSAGNVQVVAAGTSSFPCHLVAINVSSSGGNTDLFSAVTLPTAYKSIISQPRTNIAGAVLANSTQGWETNLRVKFTGGLVRGRTTVADANYTVLNSDMTIAYTSLTAARVVTLPAQGLTLLVGQEFTIKDESGLCDGTKTITVSPPSGTIDGAASLAIASAYGKVSVYTNGSNWYTR